MKKQKEILFDHIFENPFIGICIADENGNCIMVNQTQTRISGIPKEKCVGFSLASLAENQTLSVSSTEAVLKTRDEVNLHQISTGGKAYDVKGIPLFDDDGEIEYVVNYLLDVSEIEKFKDLVSRLQADKERIQEKIQQLTANRTVEGELVFRSSRMQAVVEVTKKVAFSHAPVLITGPSGSGKELVADLIHRTGDRSHKPFIKVNCAALPEALLESELFGYEPGAFTGGNPKGSKGIFEAADGGSLLLDEISEMPMSLQVKLLRVLQDQMVRRIGGNELIKVDVRIMAATNAPLKVNIEEKKFREDLFYRLNVIPIQVPGLAQRKEDIPVLIMHFIDEFNDIYNVKKEISPDAVKLLMSRQYPGNVRELRNLIERLFIICQASIKITEDDVRLCCDEGEDTESPAGVPDLFSGKPLKEMVASYERRVLEEYLKQYNAETASKLLKIDSGTISRKIKKYGLR